jgi:putative tricarboxylic transport membrane protein
MLKDIISGGVLLALSVGYYVTATRFPTSALDTSVSASAFPELIGMIGAFFSLLLIGQALWRASAQRIAAATPRDEEAHSPLADWDTHRAALGLLVIVALYLLALGTLGYPVALAGLIFAVATYQGIPLSWRSVAVSIGGALLFWLFFVQFLGIHMPVGFWDRSSELSPLLSASTALA